MAANLLMVLAFGGLHTLTAQLRVQKGAVASCGIPEEGVRCIYTCIACISHLALLVAWQRQEGAFLWHLPIPQALGGEPARPSIDLALTAAWYTVMLTASLLPHGILTFVGVQQVWTNTSSLQEARAEPGQDAGAAAPPKLLTSGWYGVVRHPMYTLTLLAGTLHSSLPGHLALYAAGLVLYLHWFGLAAEEAKLVQLFGPAYKTYQATTPAVLPRLCPRRADQRQ